MKLKALLSEITSDEMKKIGYKLIPFDDSKADLFVDWISNFNTTGKAPRGFKDLFDRIKYLKDSVKFYKDYNKLPQPVYATFYYWKEKDIDSIVDNIFSKKDAANTVSELKLKSATFVNESLMAEKRFKETANIIDNLLSRLSGFHKKALVGDLVVRFVKADKLRAKAAYKSQLDEIWISETYTREVNSTKYASLPYIIIHELGHRFEYKVKVPSWFVYSQWATTKYSTADTMHDGEQFAEVFALSFFGTQEFPNLADKVNLFIDKMKGN